MTDNDQPIDSFADTLLALRSDYRRYLKVARESHSPLRAYVAAAACFGFIAGSVYRYGHWVRGLTPWPLSLPLKLTYHLSNLLVQLLLGVRISAACEIGPGLYIAHFGGIVVHGSMGANCSIGQGVTIGSKGGGRSNGYPVLGSGVYLGAGAMVIGRIRVGNDVIVGANTVVIHDVPDGYRVVSAATRMLPPRATSTSQPTAVDTLRTQSQPACTLDHSGVDRDVQPGALATKV